MNAASFYGNAAFTKRSRNLERRLQRSNYLNQHHPPSKILFEADDECKYFASQNSALEYSDRNANKDAKKRGVFAFELDASGKRNFLVCSVEHIWMLIRNKKAKNRNFYEVIPEGKPCKLYFDIDFKITDDDDDQRGRIKRNGFEELKLFLRKVKESLTEEFGVKRFGDVIDLDSSTERKFSRHVIFDKVVFEDNSAVGRFVKKLVSGNGGEKFDFVDLGVYSRNRNFRMFQCSKAGKNRILELSEKSSKVLKSASTFRIFQKSLVATFENVPEKGEIISFGTSSLAKNRGGKLHVSNAGYSTPQRSTSPSPFPEIDAFIRGLIAPEGGYIRKINWKSTAEAAVEYEIAGFRHCERIGRWHKSNNIKFVALLGRGVYFQLCHDPECENFKSRDRRLPRDVQPWLSLFQDSEEMFGEEDDDFLVQAADLAEEEAILLRASE